MQNRRFLRKFTIATVVIGTRHNSPPQSTKDDTLSTPVTEATGVPNITSVPHYMIPPAQGAPPPAPTVETTTPPSMEALPPPPVLPAPQLPARPLMEADHVVPPRENHSQCLPRMPPTSPNHDPSYPPLASTGHPIELSNHLIDTILPSQSCCQHSTYCAVVTTSSGGQNEFSLYEANVLADTTDLFTAYISSEELFF